MMAYAYGNESAQNAINTSDPLPPRTIASAIGRADGLNERLAKVREHLSLISDQIGGPRPTEASNSKAQMATSAGAVDRLNHSVEDAHAALSYIESLLGSISRALG